MPEQESKPMSHHLSRLKYWFKCWKIELSEYKYLIILAVIFLILAEITSFYASTYVDTITAKPSADLILDHIPTLNLDIIYVYGFLLVNITIVIYAILFRVKEFHEIAFLFCLLIFIRSIFITMTHMGVPAGAQDITQGPSLYLSLNFRNDLFFSGHAALPFMAFLVFRKEAIKYFFFAMTIILSATVLFMHVHYSIDVFSAYFIAFGVYKFGEWFISKGYLRTKKTVRA